MTRQRFPHVVEWVPDYRECEWRVFNRYADIDEAERRVKALRKSGFRACLQEEVA